MTRPPLSSITGACGGAGARARSTGPGGRPKTITYIENPTVRKVTFKKRKKGLVKKISELSTLCGVKACVVIYGPSDPPLDAWPNVQQATETLTEFKGLPLIQQTRKMMSQDEFMRDRLKKMQEQIPKLDRDITDAESGHLVAQCLAGVTLLELMSPKDLLRLTRRIDRDLFMLHERLKKLDVKEPLKKEKEIAAGAGAGGGGGVEPAPPLPNPAANMAPPPYPTIPLDPATIEVLQNQQNFMDPLNYHSGSVVLPPPPQYQQPRSLPEDDENSWIRFLLNFDD